MRLVEGDIEKERLGRVLSGGEPAQGLVHDEALGAIRQRDPLAGRDPPERFEANR